MIISLVAALTATYLSFLVLLYFMQSKLIFIGTKPDYLLYQKLTYCAANFTSAGGLLQGWKVIGNKPDSNVIIIYFGGNAEDTSGMLPILQKLDASTAYTFNYRSYGLSEGSASETNIYQDALAIYDHVIKQYPEKNIMIVGHSLGSAVAGYVASMRAVDKLVLLAPLSSISEIAYSKFNRAVPAFLVRHRFDLVNHARKVTAETLVIIGLCDTIIKNSFSFKTYKNITAKKHLLEVQNAGHNDLFKIDTTIEHINQFTNY